MASVPAGGYDITLKVSKGYYYGGYYSDYSKKGTYAGGETATKDGTNYAGGAGSWMKKNAYAENGEAMNPVANRTYYLKEVPSNYLKPYMHIVYDERSQGIVNEIKKMFLITGIDDMNYSSTGLITENITLGTKKQTASYKVESTVDSSKNTTLTTTSLFGGKGYLVVWDQSSSLAENYQFQYTPYWVTPDGVTVNGAVTRTVNTQNKHYYGTFDQTESNLGIYRIDN
jgi:hypothetical protein